MAGLMTASQNTVMVISRDDVILNKRYDKDFARCRWSSLSAPTPSDSTFFSRYPSKLVGKPVVGIAVKGFIGADKEHNVPQSSVFR